MDNAIRRARALDGLFGAALPVYRLLRCHKETSQKDDEAFGSDR
jgi:hypothetical protein